MKKKTKKKVIKKSTKMVEKKEPKKKEDKKKTKKNKKMTKIYKHPNIPKEVFIDEAVNDLTDRKDKSVMSFEEYIEFKQKQRDEGKFVFIPGRPAKYDPKMCSMMVEFFENARMELREIKNYYRPDPEMNGDDISVFESGERAGPLRSCIPKESAPIFPTFQRFCTNIGIVRKTLYERLDIYEDISNAYHFCKELQHTILIEGTMLGFYKDSFSQFLLKNDFDYKDKHEVDIHDDKVVKTQEETIESLQKELAEIQKQKSLIGKAT